MLHDELAVTVPDDDPSEERFVTVGMDALGRAEYVRGEPMKKDYDFSRGKRGAVLRTPPGKTRITIRIDDDVLGWFRTQVHEAGGGSYQTLMNDALRRFIESHEQGLEDTLRRVLREELPRCAGRKAAGATRR